MLAIDMVSGCPPTSIALSEQRTPRAPALAFLPGVGWPSIPGSSASGV